MHFLSDHATFIRSEMSRFSLFWCFDELDLFSYQYAAGIRQWRHFSNLGGRGWLDRRPFLIPIHLGTILHRRRYWYRVVCSRQYAYIYFKYTSHIIPTKVRSEKTFSTVKKVLFHFLRAGGGSTDPSQIDATGIRHLLYQHDRNCDCYVHIFDNPLPLPWTQNPGEWRRPLFVNRIHTNIAR